MIVVTGQADVPLALEAIKTGALDFIEKPYRDETLLGAVRAALCGDDTNSLRESEKIEIQERLAMLSHRTASSRRSCPRGQLNKTIASHLKIEPRSIDIHRASIMTKMQAKSLSYLVRMMLLAGA